MRLGFAAILATALLSAATATGLEVGDPAPAFTAPSTHGEISLDQFASEKHVVLAFYFKDFTGG